MAKYSPLPYIQVGADLTFNLHRNDVWDGLIESFHTPAHIYTGRDMTEQEWLTSNNPVAMLQRLTVAGSLDEVSLNRKLRLFACACCRQVWHSFTDECSRQAVEVAERYADGKAIEWERVLAYADATRADMWNPYCRAAAICLRKAPFANRNATLFDIQDTRPGMDAATQAALLRCVVGNPFRPATLPRLCWDGNVYDRCQNCKRIPCTCQNHWEERQPCPWLTWNDGTVPKLAQTIYNDRAFDQLPILADALEEAGCTDVACLGCGGTGIWRAEGFDEKADCCNGTGHVPNPILAHLRGPGPHARGCWVLDLVLGKE